MNIFRSGVTITICLALLLSSFTSLNINAIQPIQSVGIDNSPGKNLPQSNSASLPAPETEFYEYQVETADNIQPTIDEFLKNDARLVLVSATQSKIYGQKTANNIYQLKFKNKTFTPAVNNNQYLTPQETKISNIESPNKDTIEKKLLDYKSHVNYINQLKTKSRLNPSIIIKPKTVYQKFADYTPNDPLYKYQWGLSNTGKYSKLNFDETAKKIQLVEIDSLSGQDIQYKNIQQTYPKQGKGIRVGVTDSGLDYTHPDIENQILLNQGEIPEALKTKYDTNQDGIVESKEVLDIIRQDPNWDYNGDGKIDLEDVLNDKSEFMDKIDQDGNDLVDDLIGWDFGDNDNDVMDNDGHGTHVTGTIAAQSNNGIGMAGVSANAKILPIKIFGEAGASDEVIISSLNYSVGKIDVMNMSWGGLDSSPYQDMIQTEYYKSFQSMVDSGIIPIAAAGNDDTLASNFSPARFDDAIVVGSNNALGKKSNFSNYGGKVDIVAPGEDIISLKSKSAKEIPDLVIADNYIILSGTSMASPAVAGIVANYLAQNPNKTSKEIKHLLRKSTPDYKNYDLKLGYGKINTDLLSTSKVNMADFDYDFINFYSQENLADTKKFGTKSGSNFVIEAADYELKPSTDGEPKVNLIWKLIKDNLNAQEANLELNSTQYLDGSGLVRLRNKQKPENSKILDIQITNININETYEPYGNLDFIPIKSVYNQNVDTVSLKLEIESHSKRNSPGFEVASKSQYFIPYTLCKNNPVSLCSDKFNLGYIEAKNIPKSSDTLYITFIKVNTIANTETTIGRKVIFVDKTMRSNFPYVSSQEDTTSVIENKLVADINNDGKKDIIYIEDGQELGASGSFGQKDIDFRVNVIDSSGQELKGFPYLIRPLLLGAGPTGEGQEQKTVRDRSPSKPIIADINNDGQKEIVFYTTNKNDFYDNDITLVNKVYAVNFDGKLLENYPKVIFKSESYNTVVNPNAMPNFGPYMSSQISINDTNGDGINEIQFLARDGYYYQWQNNFANLKTPAKTQVYDLFALNNSPSYDGQSVLNDYPLGREIKPAFSDIDKDGKLESIIAIKDRVSIINQQGKVTSMFQIPVKVCAISKACPDGKLNEFVAGSPVIADIDNDNKPEILFTTANLYANSKVDNNPNFEIVPYMQGYNSNIYILNADGSLKNKTEINNFLTAGELSVGQLDSDPELEITLLSSNNPSSEPIEANENSQFAKQSKLYLFNHDLSLKSGFPFVVPGNATYSDTPQNLLTSVNDRVLIDDIDGDGQNEMLFSNTNNFWVVDQKGQLNSKYSKTLSSYNYANSTSFAELNDIDNDGHKELIITYTGSRNSGSVDQLRSFTNKRYLMVFDLPKKTTLTTLATLDSGVKWSSYYGDDNNTNNLFNYIAPKLAEAVPVPIKPVENTAQPPITQPSLTITTTTITGVNQLIRSGNTNNSVYQTGLMLILLSSIIYPLAKIVRFN